MNVIFKKTGVRGYGVFIKRENLPDLEMNPAPGFDELMPHDLLHFLVEQEFGLRHAVFGQVAAGGTSGTFRQSASESKSAKTDARERRKINRKGKALMKSDLVEYAQSERATFVCWHDWLSHSPDEKLRSLAKDMKITADSILDRMPEIERQRFSKEKLARIRDRMDEISAKWSRLKVNESINLVW